MVPLDLSTYLAPITCGCFVLFFVRGARAEGHSPWLWGGSSLAAWLGFTGAVHSGLAGGVASQVCLFVALGLAGSRRVES